RPVFCFAPSPILCATFLRAGLAGRASLSPPRNWAPSSRAAPGDVGRVGRRVGAWVGSRAMQPGQSRAQRFSRFLPELTETRRQPPRDVHGQRARRLLTAWAASSGGASGAAEAASARLPCGRMRMAAWPGMTFEDPWEAHWEVQWGHPPPPDMPAMEVSALQFDLELPPVFDRGSGQHHESHESHESHQPRHERHEHEHTVAHLEHEHQDDLGLALISSGTTVFLAMISAIFAIRLFREMLRPTPGAGLVGEGQAQVVQLDIPGVPPFRPFSGQGYRLTVEKPEERSGAPRPRHCRFRRRRRTRQRSELGAER
ncbi:unnamed protein product, partial [Effrenium voratum]